ncbi:MAG TPA: helicase HerA-like domain-containing protein [Paenalcaligenes sp.]|nr:helicase HerA-like domain-containing protein [Paenalcaligenes sp.]
MVQPISVAYHDNHSIKLLPQMANRHGCITGATGTGKTVSLQVLAEAFSRQGTAVFVADIKGDLSGITQAGVPNEKLEKRLQRYQIPAPEWQANPSAFWDVLAEQGHPIRVTVSDLGPLLLSRMLDLNDTQEGVMNVLFRVADEEGLLLLDFKDLRSMLRYVGENASTLRAQYGHIAPQSVGAIQRALLRLENEGAEYFFGEPALDIFDWLRTDASGRGLVNILAADRLVQSPRLYAIFMLWMLAELYEKLPEVGDLPQPKLVFFFDEAHLLFSTAPKALLERIEQVLRLIRSKGVGVFFVTQSPGDIPDVILGQLGHRIQHALRAYTPREQKAIRTVAQTMRPNPELNIEAAITELGVGEALVSMLDDQGRPTITQRAWMAAPGSRIGAATLEEKQQIINASPFAGKYDTVIDRESAYELLEQRVAEQEAQDSARQSGGALGAISDLLIGSTGPRGGRRDGIVQSVMKSELRRGARQLLRGLLSSLRGGR